MIPQVITVIEPLRMFIIHNTNLSNEDIEGYIRATEDNAELSKMIYVMKVPATAFVVFTSFQTKEFEQPEYQESWIIQTEIQDRWHQISEGNDVVAWEDEAVRSKSIRALNQSLEFPLFQTYDNYVSISDKVKGIMGCKFMQYYLLNLLPNDSRLNNYVYKLIRPMFKKLRREFGRRDLQFGFNQIVLFDNKIEQLKAAIKKINMVNVSFFGYFKALKDCLRTMQYQAMIYDIVKMNFDIWIPDFMN